MHRLLLSLALAALASSAAAQATYKAPRNAFGQPDFEGVWTNASLTSLERPANFKTLTITEAQAKAAEQARAKMMSASNAPTDPNAPAPPAANDPGGYNTAWIDPGTTYGRIGGQVRTSWLVDPADGKLPWSPAGRKLFDATLKSARMNFDGPEGRPLGERCILGFGSTAGPPMMNVLYNNNYQIQQAKDHVVIVVEMNHDARIIRLNDKHRTDGVRPYMGDSIGWYDGDTLVVETTNIPAAQHFMGAWKDLKVTERFTRVGQHRVHYQFTVEDPTVWDKPWGGEYEFLPLQGVIYEYACHEGNYALPGILAGARAEEAEKAEAAKKAAAEKAEADKATAAKATGKKGAPAKSAS